MHKLELESTIGLFLALFLLIGFFFVTWGKFMFILFYHKISLRILGLLFMCSAIFGFFNLKKDISFNKYFIHHQ